jgi:hypothetical protein
MMIVVPSKLSSIATCLKQRPAGNGTTEPLRKNMFDCWMSAAIVIFSGNFFCHKNKKVALIKPKPNECFHPGLSKKEKSCD